MKNNFKFKTPFFVVSFGFFLCILTIFVFYFCENHAGFSLKKISSSFDRISDWEVDANAAYDKWHIENILAQEFNYLGAGAQSYAFLSADGRFVLKFFKTKHLKPKRWLKFLPFPFLNQYRFRKIDKRIQNRRELFNSYYLAYTELKEESGLIYIHLNRTKHLKKRIKIFDRLRNCFIVNLDDFEFVLQKKGLLVQDRIMALMQQEKKEEVGILLQKVLDQVVMQCKKGIIDRDSGISHNYGFVGDEVIHFDIGRIVKDEQARDPFYYQREVLRVASKLESWLSDHYPELLPLLDEAIHKTIEQ